jgi:hypothetical protein
MLCIGLFVWYKITSITSDFLPILCCSHLLKIKIGVCGEMKKPMAKNA